MNKFKLLFCVLLLIPNISFAATTNGVDGYVSRACGFDNDKDGNYGEAGECDYCDGTGVTPDPDQDGANEDEIYVNCQTGTDDTGCGASGTPCKSIEYALGKTNGSSYGGSEEDIICVAGTCGAYNGGLTPGSINMTITQDGLNTTQTRNANVGNDTGNAEQFNYEYPDDPFMIIGWDTDNDGDYPPHDTNQPYPAIIDGCANANQLDTCTTSAGNTLFSLAQSDKLEIAHMKIANIGVLAPGSTSQTNRQVFLWSGGYAPDHHRIHDIEIYRPLANASSYTDHMIIGFKMTSSQKVDYIALENILIEKGNGWHMRGWTGASESIRGTNLRFKNMTVLNPPISPSISVGPRGGSILGMKIWSSSNVEYIDNAYLDPEHGSPEEAAIFQSIANSNFYIRSNRFKNFNAPIKTNFRDSDNLGVAIDGLYIDRNYIYFTDTSTMNSTQSLIFIGAKATNGQERTECPANACSSTTTACTGAGAKDNQDCGCVDAQAKMLNVSITNNIIDAANYPNVRQGISIKLGDNCHDVAETNFGPVTIANNTFKNWNPTTSDGEGKQATRAPILIGRTIVNDWDYKYVKGNINVYNNLVTGLNNDRAVINIKRGEQGCGPTTGTSCTPASNYGSGDWFANNNIYNGTGVSYLRGEDCAVNADCTGSGVCNAGDRCVYSTLAAWQSVTGQDANSKTCTPTFDSSGIRLASGDTCARNAGDNTNCTTKDFDGESRSDGNCDIGADEYTSGGSTPGFLKLVSGTYSVGENGSSVIISVSRTGGSDGSASVNYNVTGLTATGGASCSGSTDFINTSGTLNWTTGNSDTKTFTVTICDDATVESNETVQITLSGAAGASLDAPASAVLTITNDDQATGTSPTVDIPFVKSMCSQTDGTVFTIPSVTVEGGLSKINRALVVAIGAEGSYNSGDPTCDLGDNGVSVVWNSGYNLARLNSVKGLNGTTVGACSGIFYLLNPPPGTGDVVITFANTALDVQAIAVPMYNVKQSTPISVVSGTTASGQAGSPIVTSITTTLPDSMVLDALALGERVGGGNIIPNTGQVELGDMSCGTTGSHTGVSSRKAFSPGLIPMGWSWTLQTGETSAYRYAHTLAAFQYDGTPPATTTTTIPVTTTTLITGAPTIGNACILPCVPIQ